MSLAEIIKNQEFFKNLVQKKEKKLFSNAILFFCDDKITANNVLILTALMMQYPIFELFDENSAEFLQVKNGSNLDVKVYPKGEKLLVSDSNEIVSECFIKPVNFENKIFIINNFDNSTDEAQNKLLKVLEEPPKNVYFLISAQRPDRVLPTIKSRCDKVTILPIGKNEIESVCKNILACILGQGYFGKTLLLDADENLKPMCDFAVEIFTQMKSSRDVLKFSKRFLEFGEKADLILEILSYCIGDMIKIKCESENLCKLSPYIENLKNVEAEFSIQALCEIEKLLSEFRQREDFNANMTALVDNFLLKILEVKYICK